MKTFFDKRMKFQSQQEENEYFWRLFTERSSKRYIGQMLDTGCTLEQMAGSYMGMPQPNHLMYKLDPLLMHDGQIMYEFLVEYDMMEPQVGIYYGVKGLNIGGFDMDEAIAIMDEDWMRVEFSITTCLDNTFPDKNFKYAYRDTNNANNGTYWPKWISLGQEESIQIGINAIKIMRTIYETYKRDPEQFVKRNSAKLISDPVISFNQEAWQHLIDNICFSKSGNQESDAKANKLAQAMFVHIIDCFSHGDKRLWVRAPFYEHALRSTSDNATWSCMMILIFGRISEAVNVRLKKSPQAQKQLSPPWKYLVNVFMSKFERHWTPDIKTSAQRLRKNLQDYCENLFNEVVGDSLDRIF